MRIFKQWNQPFFIIFDICKIDHWFLEYVTFLRYIIIDKFFLINDWNKSGNIFEFRNIIFPNKFFKIRFTNIYYYLTCLLP